MSPATTHPRRVLRTGGGRRPGTTRRPAEPATLFDAAPTEPVARADARDAAGAAGAIALEVGVARTAEAVREQGPAGSAVMEHCPAGSGETLDRIVVGGWERLASRAPTACPLCDGTMEPIYGMHPRPIGGRCRDCGTTLS